MQIIDINKDSETHLNIEKAIEFCGGKGKYQKYI